MFLVVSSGDHNDNAPPVRLRGSAPAGNEPLATATATENELPLRGRKLLLVEDEAIVAMSVELALRDFGCDEVFVALSLAEGLGFAQERPIDAAVLDVNLRGVEVFPVADVLVARATPFVVATGYGAESIRPDLRNHPIIRKPYQPRDLREVLIGLLGRDAK